MVNVVGILEPDGRTFVDGIYKKKDAKLLQIAILNTIHIGVKGIQKAKVEVELKQKKMEVFIYRNNVVVDILKGKEIDENVDDLAVDKDKVVGMVVIIYSIDVENIVVYKVKI